MYCKKCGAQIPDGTKFCPSCGAAQSQETAGDTYRPFGDDAMNSAPKSSYDDFAKGYQPQQQTAAPVYGQQDPYHTVPAYGQTAGEPTVKMGGYLTWAIIVTALCSWPFGIPAIINAAKINKLNGEGDFIGAEDAAKKSKKWTIVSAIVGFVLEIILIIVYAAAIAGAGRSYYGY